MSTQKLENLLSCQLNYPIVYVWLSIKPSVCVQWAMSRWSKVGSKCLKSGQKLGTEEKGEGMEITGDTKNTDDDGKRFWSSVMYKWTPWVFLNWLQSILNFNSNLWKEGESW